MDNILDVLKTSSVDLTIIDIAQKMDIDRHTAAKRLESLRSQGLVDFRTVGKSKLWRLSNPLIGVLKNNSSISDSMKGIISSLQGHVNIQSEDHSVIWSNDLMKKCHAIESDRSLCKNCPVEKTFRTGKPTEVVMKEWNHMKNVKIIAQPIKDDKNHTIAVMEIIKNIDNKNIKRQ